MRHGFWPNGTPACAENKRAAHYGQPFRESAKSRVLAAGCAGRTSRGAGLQTRFDIKAHVRMEFHGDRLGFVHQAGFNQKSVSINFIYDVVVFLLIQSKRQAWPASAGRHVDPDGGHFLAGEVHIELLFGSLGEFKHGNPPLMWERW